MQEFSDKGDTIGFYARIWRGAIKNVADDLSLKVDSSEKIFLASYQRKTDFYEVAETLVTRNSNQDCIGDVHILAMERKLAR